ncbi:hypothetical protein BXP70_00520 [Hymenobacter crusticola]|uniref:Uncharacterized protein n=1 Tax=Hymenobacter crusticola TaxID=1770526 RepID=A0A243WIT6_9BACT|nr:hypothetical protein BXP70_00520 [Hymenobacter crusticola]
MFLNEFKLVCFWERTKLNIYPCPMKLVLLRIALLLYLFTLSFTVGRISALLRLPSPLATLAAERIAALRGVEAKQLVVRPR